MRSRYPQLPFERYADDAIVHCRTEAEAQEVRTAIAARMEECRLELHQLQPGHFRRSGEIDSHGDSKLESAFAQ
jgi:hypothetical protein